MKDTITVTGTQLYRLCYDIVRAFGASESDATDTAYMMNEADLRGVDTHGCARISMLTNMIISGKIKLDAEFKVIRESDNFLYYDGDYGIGFASGAQATYKTIEKAKKSGICFTSVTHSGFWGASGSYAQEIANAGMLGLAASNTSAALAPFGGTGQCIGNSPWSMAFPGTKKYPFPIMFDMACSEVAFGKLQMALRNNYESIPPTWFVSTVTGKPITDPKEAMAGCLNHTASFMPFGGVKGYVIDAFIEILTSVLAGAALPTENGQTVVVTEDKTVENSGLCILAVDITKIRPWEEIEKSLDAFLDLLKSCPPAYGFDEVLVPGELEANFKKKRSAEPFEITAQVGNELLTAAKHCGYVDENASIQDLLDKVS